MRVWSSLSEWCFMIFCVHDSYFLCSRPPLYSVLRTTIFCVEHRFCVEDCYFLYLGASYFVFNCYILSWELLYFELRKVILCVQDLYILNWEPLYFVFRNVIFWIEDRYILRSGPLPVGDISFQTPLLDQFLNTARYFGNKILSSKPFCFVIKLQYDFVSWELLNVRVLEA